MALILFGIRTLPKEHSFCEECLSDLKWLLLTAELREEYDGLVKPKAELGKVKLIYKFTRERAPDYLKSLGLKPNPELNQKAAEQWMRGIRTYLSELGRRGGKIGGKSTSLAKGRASRANGKLGGRPRKRKYSIGNSQTEGGQVLD